MAISHKDVIAYLAIQKTMGGDEIILDKLPSFQSPSFRKTVATLTPNLTSSQAKKKIKISSDSLLTSFKKLTAEQIDEKPKQIIEKKQVNSANRVQIPDFSTLKEFYDYLQTSAIYQNKALRDSKTKKTVIVKHTGSCSSALAVLTMIPTQEDLKKGLVLQGEDGKLLDRMLLAINIKRQDVYCSSVLKHPQLNTLLTWREKLQCKQLMEKELALLSCEMVLILGEKCAQIMLKTGKSIEKLRNSLHSLRKNDILKDRAFIVTYHPHQLIKNPVLKQNAWIDLKWLQELQKNKLG